MSGCPSCPRPPSRVPSDMPSWMVSKEPSTFSVVITVIFIFLTGIAVRLGLAVLGWWKF